MRMPSNPLHRYPKTRVIECNIPERLSFKEAQEYFFPGRGLGSLHSDCKFLGIDTVAVRDGWGSLTKQNLYILYVYMFWRTENPLIDKRNYWKDCSSSEDIANKVPLSAETAITAVRLSYMTKYGGSRELFEREFKSFMDAKKAKILASQKLVA